MESNSVVEPASNNKSAICTTCMIAEKFKRLYVVELTIIIDT